MPKFKVGDLVKIVKLDEEWPSFSEEMEVMKNKNCVYKISRIKDFGEIAYTLESDEGEWLWVERWLEFSSPEERIESHRLGLENKIKQLWERQDYVRNRLTSNGL